MKIGHDLIRDLYVYKFPQEYQQLLKQKFPNIEFIEIDPLNYTDTLLQDIEVYIGDRISIEMIDKMPNLKWIHLTSVGIDKIIGLQRDILVTNSADIMTDSVVASAMAFMFSLGRGFHYGSSREEFSAKLPPGEIFNQIVYIFGRGNIALKLEEKCRALGMLTLRCSHIYPPYRMIKREDGTEFPSRGLDTLETLNKSDYVINTLPLVPDTKYYFDRLAFIAMKSSGYFINVGRGQTVVEQDLINALKNNRIAGAGLDVFDTEPLNPGSPLWEMKNVIITPHVAGWSSGYWKRQYELIEYNLNSYLNRIKLKNLVVLNR